MQAEPNRCRSLAIIAVSLHCALPGSLAAAQTYPSKPVRLVLPFPPGGGIDALGRIVGQKLAGQLGQAVIPENRPGAGGNVGTEYAARAAPDGHTMLLASAGIAVSPILYKKLGYDPVRDFAPISLVAQVSNLLVVHPSVPAKNLRDLVRIAKARPGQLNFASGGVGTINHLGGELFKSLTGTSVVHVPYKGAGEAIVGLTGGHVEMAVLPVPATLPHVRAGRVRALAALSRERLQALPDVATARESGIDDFVLVTTYGILVPAATSREIVDRLHREWTKIAAMSDTREKLTAVGFDTVVSTPEEYANTIKADLARWSHVIKDAGLKID
jgi:tripartite-type tricarboxylate transporter receptor subunit TctC